MIGLTDCEQSKVGEGGERSKEGRVSSGHEGKLSVSFAGTTDREGGSQF